LEKIKNIVGKNINGKILLGKKIGKYCKRYSLNIESLANIKEK